MVDVCWLLTHECCNQKHEMENKGSEEEVFQQNVNNFFKNFENLKAKIALKLESPIFFFEDKIIRVQLIEGGIQYYC